jgi:hypothetical protein
MSPHSGTEQDRGNTGFGQLQQHTAVKPGVCTLNDAAIDQAKGHAAPALAGFIQGEGVAFGTNFELGTIKEQCGHRIKGWLQPM